MTDGEALAWLAAQPDRRTTVSQADLAKRWGWSTSTVSRRLAAWKRDKAIVRRGDAIIATSVATPETAGATSRATLHKTLQPDDCNTDETIAATNPETVAVQAADAPAEKPEFQCNEPQQDCTSEPPPVASPAPEPPTMDVLKSRDVFRTACLVLAQLAAMAAAGVAAYFSIRGFVVMFPGDPMGARAIDIVAEAMKVTSVGLLGAWGCTLLRGWRVTLIVFIVATAAINGLGVYSQLLAAHLSDRAVKQADAAATAESNMVRVEATVLYWQHKVDDLRDQIRQQREAAATEAKAEPRRARWITDRADDKLAPHKAELDRDEQHLADLRGQEAQARARSKVADAHSAANAAPIVEVAKQFGIDVSDKDRVIRWLSLIMACVCDPFAIVILAAIASRRRGGLGLAT